jgi:glycosyltransferase involved in cell wall biosynthesis
MRLMLHATHSPYRFDSTVPRVGGAELALRWSAEEAVRRGHEVLFVGLETGYGRGKTERHLLDSGVAVSLLRPTHLPRLANLLAGRREEEILSWLTTAMEAFRPDVVHTYAPYGDTYHVLLARRRAALTVKPKVVERVAGRAWEPLLQGPQAEAVRRAFAERDGSIFVSNFMASYAKQVLSEAKIVLGGESRVGDLLPPVPTTCPPLPQHLQEFTQSHPLIVCIIGQFRKRQDLVVRAAEQLQDMGDVGFVFVGDGSELGAVRDLANSIGVEKKCLFTGYLSFDLTWSVIGASAVAVCPTDFEGHGKVPVQYLLAGVPPLLSDIPVMRELLGSSLGVLRDCLVANEPAAFADRLRRLLTDDAYRARVADAARQKGEALRDSMATWRYVELLEEFGSVH